MSEFGGLPAPDEPVGAQPAQPQTPVRDFREMRDMDLSAQTRFDFDQAAANGDWETANQNWERMKQMAGQASVEVLLEGGDPARETRPVGAFVHPQIELERRSMFLQQKQDRVQQFVRGDSGLRQVRDYMRGVFDEYRTMNDAELGDWQPSLMTEEQRFNYMAKLQPVRRDPNEVADLRQELVKIDQRGKQVDPDFSVFTHPETKKWAEWLNREAGITGLGYLQSKEQELEMGVVGRAAYVAAEAIETVTDIPLAVGYQLWEWTDQGLRGLGLPSISPPINYVEGPNGEVLLNQERPHPGYLEAAQALWTMAGGGDVAKSVARLNRVRNMEQAERHGLTKVIHGTANVAGAFLGFGLPAGAAISTGQRTFAVLSKKGLGVLAGLGVKGAASTRALQLVELWGGRFGAAGGLGTFQATAYGKQQGYLNQYLHGMAMFPALAVLGHYGPRLERILQTRAKMPGKVAQMVSEGMVMGVPFATLEVAELGLWEHLKNPNESTLDIYLKNILGAMLFKGMFGGKVPTMQQQAMMSARFHVERNQARAAFAEDLAMGRVDPARIPPGVEVSNLAALGEIVLRKKASQDPVERQRIQEEQRALEEQLDVKEFGLEPQVTRELEQIGKEEAGEAPQQVGPEFARAAREAGRRYREAGGEERRLEEAGIQPAQVGERNVFSRLQKMVQRRVGKGKQEAGVVIGGEQTIPIKGAADVLEYKDVARAAKKAGMKVSEVSLTHTHPLSDPASINDMANFASIKGRHGSEAAPDFIVTGETIYRFVPARERTFTYGELAKLRTEAATEHKALTTEGVRQAAKLHGKEVMTEAWGKFSKGEQLTRQERQVVAGIRKTLKEAVSGIAMRFGLKMTEVTADQAMREMRERAPSPAVEEVKMAVEPVRERPGETTRMPTRGEERRGARMGPGSMQAPPGFQVEPVEGARRTTLDDIFAEMGGRLPRKGVRVPFTQVRIGGKPGDPVRPAMRKGRIGGGKGVEGLFKIFENLVRTRAGRDLIVASHEWSHAMQRHMQAERGGQEFNLAARKWMASLDTAMVVEEFPKILEGYGGWEQLSIVRKGMEVWAEWHARELLGDPRLETEAPRLTAYFRNQLAQPGNAAIREQFNRIKGLITQYKMIGARGRLEASIESARDIASESLRATQPTKLEQARDRVLRNFFDDVIVLKRGTEKWLEATGVDPMDVGIMEDPARVWDALRMTAPKQAESFVMDGITMPNGKHVPGMESILESVKGRKREFRNYLVAVLNAQRIKRGKLATLSMEDYVSEIRRLQTENPDFRLAARDLKAWTDTIVDWVAGAGNLAPEQAQRIKDAYVVWVPFLRMMEGPEAHGVSGRKVAPVREAIGRVKGGGTERIRDPLNAMFDSVTAMISNAHRNMVVSALYKMAVGREAGGMATVVPKSMVPKTHPLREILNAIERQVEMPKEAQFFFEDMISALQDANALSPQTITLFAQKVLPGGERNIIAFTPRLTEAELDRVARGDLGLRKIAERQQGKNLWLEIDPAIYEVLIGLDVPPMHKFFESGWLGSWLRKASSVRRFFATGVAPGFTVANIVRDALSQPIFTQDGSFAPFGGFVRMIKGAISYHHDRGPGSIRELYDALGVRISSFFHEGTRQKIIGESRTILQKTKAALEYTESIFATPENYLRIHEFKKVYDRARTEGKTETEAQMLALEAGREITVNFARGGVISRFVNSMTPYFNASLQGQRKLWRQVLLGGDGRTDAERARIQRASFLNGMANITMPSMILWWMNHNEEWYQDLPEWRKLLFFNMKISDEFMISLPKPFEAGVLFGGIPEAFMEKWVNENGQPPGLGTVFADGLFPYLKGPGDFLPALLQPIIELTTNFDFFRRRPLTPDWIASNRIPADQATFYTSESAKILSRALNGAASPIEIEKILGGYTSGTGTYALRMMDEITGLKDHPGFSMSPIQRFFTQPHRAGYFQNELYRISKILDRRAGSKVASGAELNLRSQINQAKSRLSVISRAVQAGAMDSVEAERLKFDLARPLVERYEALR